MGIVQGLAVFFVTMWMFQLIWGALSAILKFLQRYRYFNAISA